MINRFSNGIVFETRNLPPHNEQVKLPKNKTSSAWFKASVSSTKGRSKFNGRVMMKCMKFINDGT